MQALERELFKQTSAQTELVMTNEKLLKDLCSTRIELQQAIKHATSLTEEKAELATMLYAKFDQDRAVLDAELKESTRQIEDLIEKNRNLKYSLETTEMRCEHFEKGYES
jgi:predicted RNase H-like nuclease (RuvC/YqgF family)